MLGGNIKYSDDFTNTMRDTINTKKIGIIVIEASSNRGIKRITLTNKEAF